LYDPTQQVVSVGSDNSSNLISFTISIVSCNRVVFKYLPSNSNIEMALIVNPNGGQPFLEFVPITGDESQFAWCMHVTDAAIYDTHAGPFGDIEHNVFSLSFETSSGPYFWVLRQVSSQLVQSALVQESQLCQAGIFPLWLLDPQESVCRLSIAEKILFKTPC
jgi:hypothetical protein